MIEYKNWEIIPINTYSDLVPDTLDTLEEATTYNIRLKSEMNGLQHAKNFISDIDERWKFFTEVGKILFPDKFMFTKEEMIEKIKELK